MSNKHPPQQTVSSSEAGAPEATILRVTSKATTPPLRGTSKATTPPLRGTPPSQEGSRKNSPPEKGEYPEGGRGLIPKLRFPEFREAEEWGIKSLGDKDISSFVNKRIPLSDLVLDSYVSTENILPDFAGKKRASKIPPSGSFTSYRPEDILIANIRPYLKKVWVADGEGAASNDVIVVRPMSGVKKSFLSSLLKSDSFIDYVMKGAKGVKMPRGDVSLMKKYTLAVPGPEEQQKIADCLSSLDTLIAAQAEKIDALKTHKKGLMQQLFPRDGETVPRLRFPEFRKTKAWPTMSAGKLFLNRVERGKLGLPVYSVTLTEGLVPRASLDRRIDDISDVRANKAAYQDDLVYNMMRMWQGALGVAPEDCMVSPAYIVLQPQGINSLFFHFLLKLPKTLKLLTAHSRGLTEDRLRLYYDDFVKVPLQCPPLLEQNRIVDCLTSLNVLITAETEKLDALKTHKKGLMQQLFPTVENELGS